MYNELVDFHPDYPFPFQNPSLSPEERVKDLVSRLTLDEKVVVFGGTIRRFPGNIRLGLQPGRVEVEGLHGVSWHGDATVFPTPLGLSQSWDRDLLRRIGRAIGLELYAKCYAPVLVPVVDLLRDPRYGRAYETLGEDAVLTGSLATAMAQGVNSRAENGYQLGIPVLKHFMAYNNEINRIWTNSVVTERNIHEYYFKVFKYPITAGAAKGIMNAYPLVNGRPPMVHPFQRKEILNKWVPDYPDTGKKEFYIVTDFKNPSHLYLHNQGFYRDEPEGRALSAADGVKAGTTLFLLMYNQVSASLYDALARGMLSEEELDEHLYRVFTMRLRVGDLDHFDTVSPYNKPDAYGSAAAVMRDNKKLALEAGQKQIVLLKNDGVLPLKGDTVKEALLLGDLGESILRDHYTPSYAYRVTIKKALENKLGKERVAFSRALDTVAFRASNGQYLVNPPSQFRDPQQPDSGGDHTPEGDQIRAIGGSARPELSEREKLFEIYDYGSGYHLLRTPINDLFAQVSYDGKFVNNTCQPGGDDADGDRYPIKALSYQGVQRFTLVELENNEVAFYNHAAGNGGLQSDADEEELNNGSFLGLNAGDAVLVPAGGPGPGDTQERLAALKKEQKFSRVLLEPAEVSIDKAAAKLGAGAPVIVVLGFEPNLNAREAVDLYKTGLSDTHNRVIRHITENLKRDCILVLKSGNPMVISPEIHANPKVRAILLLGHSGQEEGSALLSTLFDDGYRGDAPGYEGFIPMTTPAGRLSATWYRNIEDLPLTSTSHRPVSLRYPEYNETTNDNVSKLHGTLNTGILIYDIIKGKRTYQYFDGEPLYPFGYGLGYSSFEYKNFRIDNNAGFMALNLEVKNSGPRPGDEVVEFYGAYDPAQSRKSRFVQPKKRLLAYERIQNLKPGESRTVSCRIDITDKLGVWDLTRDMFWVEPGEYTIEAAHSANDPGALKQSLTIAGGEIPHRVFTGVPAEALKFDDYSHLGKMELIHCTYDGETAVRLDADGSWLCYRDVDFGGGPSLLTLLVSAERDTELSLYACPPWNPKDPPETGDPEKRGKLIKTITLKDTRPDTSLPPGLGIGPGTDMNDPALINKPEWIRISAAIEGLSGIHDLYIKTSRRGAGIRWFKFSGEPDKTAAISLSPEKYLRSIRVKNGELRVKAVLEPASSMDEITWSVKDPESAENTSVRAEINSTGTLNEWGCLKALAASNGKVRVTAHSGGKSASIDILVTNQRDKDKFLLEGKPVTVDYLLLHTGITIADNIIRKKGTLKLTPFFHAPEKKYGNLNTDYDTLPPEAIEWSVTNPGGGGTELASISSDGVLCAAGIGNGPVKVRAVYKNNPDIFAERIIALENQEKRNAYRIIQAQHYDERTPYKGPPISAFAVGPVVKSLGWDLDGLSPDTGNTFEPNGNEMGVFTAAEDGDVFVYRDIDLDKGASAFIIRLASPEECGVEIFAGAKNLAEGGIPLGTIGPIPQGNSAVFRTWSTAVNPPGGRHDIFLVFRGRAKINWFQFLPV